MDWLQAALDGDRRCLWKGCGLHHCQVDHTETSGAEGRTAVDNARPLRPRHDWFKSRGYRTWRDPAGRWHVYDPDGTMITAA